MNNIAENNSNSESKDVRERLLDAAEGFFAEKGFEGTSVRDLTATAGSNIAAVNYHFGSKEKLYIEVFRRRMSEIRTIRVDSVNELMSQDDYEISLEQLLHVFAMAFIEPLTDKGGKRQFLKLLVREMSANRLPKRMFVDELAGPTLRTLGDAIIKICPDLEQKKVLQSIMSFISQLVYFVNIKEMFKDNDFTELPMDSIDEFIEHIVEFSAAGIRAAAKKGN